MRERPMRVPETSIVADAATLLAGVAWVRSQVEDLWRVPDAGAGPVPDPDAARERDLLCDLLVRSLGQAMEYLGRLSGGARPGAHVMVGGDPVRDALAMPAAGAPAVDPPADGVFGTDGPDGLNRTDDLDLAGLAGLGGPGSLAGPVYDPVYGRAGVLAGAEVIAGADVVTGAEVPAGAGLLAGADRALRGNAGPVAGARWCFTTGEVRWSEGMYELFGRDRALGPLRLDELPGHLVPADRSLVTGLLHAMTTEHRGVEGGFRILRPDGETACVRLVGEPVFGADGGVDGLWMLLWDVGGTWRVRRELTETRGRLLARHRLARAEHRVASELRRVMTPWWSGPRALPGLDVATRYFPAERATGVGGDWYEALTLPDGGVLLAVGDMSGHGVAAAPGMATLRGALRGAAMTGVTPSGVLTALNRLVVHTLPDDEVATAVCCRFEPEHRVLTWAQGGHPTPLLFRDGVGAPLESPFGVLLGAVDDPGFLEARVGLRPGDVLLMFTDGLVERRGRGTEEAVRSLLRLAPRLAGADARTCADLVVGRLGPGPYEDDACVMAVRVV